MTETNRYVEDYIDRGWAVVPVPYQSKAPILSGWPDLAIDRKNIEQYFCDKPINVGVIFGARSRNLVDVDLDSSEAVQLARYFLPPTDSIFGRTSKQSSHHMFTCRDAKYRKFITPASVDAKRATIVEIRGGSGNFQTVFPPSVHESGESIKWVANGEPLALPFSELEMYVERMAAAAVLVQSWRVGIRHDLTLALAGALLRNGYDESTVIHFVRAICETASDDEFADRQKAVMDTSGAITQNQNVCGIPTFAELVGTDVTDLVCKWLRLSAVAVPEDPTKALNTSRPNAFAFTTINDLLNEPEDPNESVWDRTLPLGGLSILAAKPKVGKSTFARNLAVAVARGDYFFGRKCIQGKVIYLVLEEKRAEIARHFRQIGAHNLPILVYSGRTPSQALVALKQAIERHNPILVVIDPLSRLIHVTDGNSYAENTQALEPLIDLAREGSTHILCLTHNGKMDRGEDGDAVIGSTAYFGAVDTLLTLKKNAKNRVLSSTSRYGTDIEPTIVVMDDDACLSSGGEIEAVRRNEAMNHVNQLLEVEPMTEPQLRDRIEMKAGVVTLAIRELLTNGTIKRVGRGEKLTFHLFAGGPAGQTRR